MRPLTTLTSRMKTERAAIIVGRVLLAMVFLVSGFGKITGWSTTAEYMAAKGFPFVPFFLVAAIVLEIGGALLLISGFKPDWGALALILFLIPTTLIFHNFWAHPPSEYRAELGNFLKNLAVLGGLCIAWASARCESDTTTDATTTTS